MPPDAQPSGFSVLDFKRALEAASHAELARLEKIARIHAAKTRGAMTPTEILNEAVLRSLNGSRTWNRSVSFVQHLSGTMRSLASHARPRGTPDWTPLEPDPDNEGALDEVTILEKHFQDRKDDDALLVLQGHAEGKAPGEIRDDLGLDRTRYETIMKSIRRAGERLGIGEGRRTR